MDSPDLGQLLKLVVPVVGGFAGGARGTGFDEGFLHGQSLAQREKDQQAQEAQHKDAMGADYLMRIADHAQSFDDPVALDQFLTIAQQAGEQAGYVKPGQLKGQITVSPNKLAAKKLQELNDQLASYEQGGYNLDDLASSGAVLELKNGQQIPITSAIDLTRKRPLSAAGQPIAKPQKIDTSQSTEEERFVQKWAKDRSKKFSELTGAEELDARTAFRAAGRADKTPQNAGVEAQFADLVDLWKQSHPGQEPPANVRTQLRKQANEVNDRPAATPLIGGTDVDAIADAIIGGDQPPTLQGLYRLGAPVRAALARKGYNLANAQLDWSATQKHLSTLNGPQQTRLRQAVDNAYHSLDVIENLAKQWDAGRYPLLTKAQLALAKAGVNGEQAASIARQLEGQIADVTSELGNVYMGGNSPTDHALALASKNLSADWSKKTLLDMLKLARTNLEIRSNSMKNTGAVGVSPQNPYLPAPPVTPPPTNRVYYDANGNPTSAPVKK